MKVYLEKFEVPESCAKCVLAYWHVGDGYTCNICRITDGDVDEHENVRSPDCPLRIVEE